MKTFLLFAFLSFASFLYADDVEDLCYEPIQETGFNMMGIAKIMYTTKIPIRNLNTVEELTDVTVAIGSESLFEALSECGIDDVEGNCEEESGASIFVFSAFNKGVTFDLDTLNEDSVKTPYTKTMFSFMNSNDYDIVGTYVKDGKTYSGTIPPCVNYSCANPKEFTPYFSKNLYGKLIIAGNTSLCADNDRNGVCEDPGNNTNNNIYMINNDYDDNNTNGTTDNTATTKNSSAAYLDIPEGKTVLWAGLSWQGYMANRAAYNNPDENAIDWTEELKKTGKSIKYKHESDTQYQSSSNAQMNWVYFNKDRMYYQSFLDITDYVNEHKGGYYWVGDIATSQGQPIGGSFGAWSITVVYEDNSEKFNNITVYNGYQAFANDTDIANAKTYAETNGCDEDNTGVGNSTTSTLTGFITPKLGDVDSNLVVFAGEGDIGLTGDWGSLTDINDVEHKLSNELNPENNIMNATISNNGVAVTSGLPYYSPNSLGSDIDTFDVSDILSNKQTTTDIRFSTTGDGYTPGLYGLQIELYIPQFCYDYAYKQQGIYFTEKNDGTALPRIQGDVVRDQAIEVKVYLKNMVASDIDITDMNLSVLDINTTQAKYIRETTQLANHGDLIASDVPDESIDVSDSYIKDVPIGTISSNDFFYLYYQIDPSKSDLNMSLNVQADYLLSLDGGDPIHYNLLLGKDMPICSTTNFKYSPENGLFNIVHYDYYNYDKGGSDRYYNLPTQVTAREGNFKLLILDPADPQYNTLLEDHPIFYTEVEMIDASAFHDTNASCSDPTSSISENVGLLIDANVTSVPFDKNTLIKAIEDGRTNLTTSSEFYKTARQNAAFRTKVYENAFDQYNQPAYKKNDDNTYDAMWTMNWQGENCVGDVNENGESNNNDKVSNYCQSGHGLNSIQIEECTKCVSVVKYICSRDNFAIRPEAFLMQMKDQNQSNASQQSAITTLANSGSSGALAPLLNLAAGYKYNIEVNATNHINNVASQGYTRTFNLNGSVRAAYKWDPRNNHVVSGCNAPWDINISMRILDGKADVNSSMNNVGEYKLHILDKKWTLVDNNTSFMQHHVAPYFKNTLDCRTNNSSVLDVNETMIPNADSDISVLNGCNITSSHTNVEANLQYNDFNITAHPYMFDMNSITPTVGLNHENVATGAYIYYADLNNAQDENMSYHLDGSIKALGKDQAALSNFVASCYAVPLKLEITTLNSRTLQNLDGANVLYRARLHDLNNSNDVQTALDINVSDATPNAPLAIQTTPTHFLKDLNGQMTTRLNLNYERKKDKAVNPFVLNFVKYTTNCNDPLNDCTFKADLTTKTTQGIKDLNSSIGIYHYYGKTHVPRQRFVGEDGNATIYYEVYCSGSTCNKALLQNGLNSQISDDPRWFINTKHTADYGVPGDVNQKTYSVGTGYVKQTQAASGNAVNNGKYDYVGLHYTGERGYPYKTTMENNASGWLLYDPYDPNTNKNDFEVEFINAASNWAGKRETDTATKRNASDQTNRRIMW